MTRLLAVALPLALFAPPRAAASPPAELFVGERTIFFEADEPLDVHIIDVDLMHARDCGRDRARGGSCILRWDEELAGMRALPWRGGRRFEMLESVLDSAEVVLDLGEPPRLPDLD